MARALLTVAPDFGDEFVEVINDGGDFLNIGEEFLNVLMLELKGLVVAPGFARQFPVIREVAGERDDLGLVGGEAHGVMGLAAVAEVAAGAGASALGEAAAAGALAGVEGEPAFA